MRDKVRVASIRADDRAQPRTSLFPDRVAEYIEDMGRGDKFPPPVVFRDKANVYWLADGFHRYHAAIGLELKTLECDVRRGELRDAILYSCGANAAHGMRRSNEDKRAAVTKLLSDEEWSKWSDREIARQCRVGADLVGKLRQQLKPVTVGNDSERTYRTKHGTTAKMKTGKVGRRDKTADDSPTPELPLQVQQDNENGWISSALWAIEREINSLPPPQEAAQRFPTHHYHTLTSAKLQAMAGWLSAFAEAWRKHVEESRHGEGTKAA